MTDPLERFLKLSVELTCFTRFELLGTGQAEAYLEATRKVVGPLLDTLLEEYDAILAATPDASPERHDALRRRLFGNQKIGPIARAITKLWYIGIWYELPRSWTEAYGARPHNTTFMVSPGAYAEGLLWTAIGAHPPGAKAQGYGSWADRPVIPEFDYGATSRPGGPALMETALGHVAPHHAAKPQHPPPPAQGQS